MRFTDKDALMRAMHGGDHPGKFFDSAIRSATGQFYDSTGAFLVGELERLDQTLNMPLQEFEWMKHIQLREDATIADDVTSYTVSTFGNVSGTGFGNGIGNGKAWAGRRTTQAGNVSLDIAKIANPLNIWLQEISYTIPELESAAKLGRPVDQQKFDALGRIHQRDIDEMVHLGDTELLDSTGTPITGLWNHSLVSKYGTQAVVATGVSGYTSWANKTAAEILKDINAALAAVWAQSGWAVMPDTIALPPAQLAYIANQPVTLAGSESILSYVLDKNIARVEHGVDLKFTKSKYLIGTDTTNPNIGTMLGNGGLDRMVVYTNDKRYVRYPMTLLQRTPIQYDSIYHKTSYFCKLGCVEAVYPEVIGYFDGI